MTDARPDTVAAKRTLSRLVNADPVARGEHALGSLPAAVRFVEDGGLARLRTVAARGTGERAARARRTLAAFRAFRAATRGEPPDQFRSGRDTPLPCGGQSTANDPGDTHR